MCVNAKLKLIEAIKLVASNLSAASANDVDHKLDQLCAEIIGMVSEDVVKENLTIQVLRIVDMMNSIHCDPECVQHEFIGGIGDYERGLANREGINIYE